MIPHVGSVEIVLHVNADGPRDLVVTPIAAWIVEPGQWHTIRNNSDTEPATYLSVLRRVAPAPSPMAESVPPDSAEEFGHVLRVEAGEPHHLGQCAKCGRTNVVEGEWCPADAGEC